MLFGSVNWQSPWQHVLWASLVKHDLMGDGSDGIYGEGLCSRGQGYRITTGWQRVPERSAIGVGEDTA